MELASNENIQVATFIIKFSDLTGFIATMMSEYENLKLNVTDATNEHIKPCVADLMAENRKNGNAQYSGHRKFDAIR